jgi:peptidoglycan hydrolase CwlO-like protein
MDFIDDIEWYLDRILKDGLTSYRWDLSALIDKIKKQYNTVDDLNNYISDIEYQNRGLQDDVGDLENKIYELKQQIEKLESK